MQEAKIDKNKSTESIMKTKYRTVVTLQSITSQYIHSFVNHFKCIAAVSLEIGFTSRATVAYSKDIYC